jgi:hypothetical protein
MRVVVMLTIMVVAFLVGAYVLGQPQSRISLLDKPNADVAASPAPNSDETTAHVISAAFGLLAAYLLVTQSKNNVVVLFSIAILSALFGRYLGPLTLPDFLQGLR